MPRFFHTRKRRKIRRHLQYHPRGHFVPAYNPGWITSGEVYYVWPIPAGGPSYSRYVRTDPNQYPFGDLFQVGGIKGDSWISHVKIVDIWHDNFGNRLARVLRVK